MPNQARHITRAPPPLLLLLLLLLLLPIFVCQCTHQVAVDVDEKGTEAAAVTISRMTVTEYIPDTVPPLVFNRPFLFWIVDDATRTVLFQGTVKDPSR
jgi:serpin B